MNMLMHIYMSVCGYMWTRRQPRTAACGACVAACFPAAESGGDYMYMCMYVHLYIYAWLCIYILVCVCLGE